MSLVGTFPDSNGNNFETNALVCFEGYELDSVGHKQYLASLKCEEAKILAARGDTSAQQYYEPFSSTVCPKEGVIASCETTTQKVLVYPDNKNLFNLTAFKGYCKATGGQLNNYTN